MEPITPCTLLTGLTTLPVAYGRQQLVCAQIPTFIYLSHEMNPILMFQTGIL